MMKTVEEVLDQWDIDSKIDNTQLDQESSKIDSLHAKYVRELTLTNKQILKLDSIQKKLYIKKKLYYEGKGSTEEYKENPLDIKILKGDIGKFIDSDKDMVAVDSAIQSQRIKKDTLESIIRQISYRSMSIKNTISYLTFINGQFT